MSITQLKKAGKLHTFIRANNHYIYSKPQNRFYQVDASYSATASTSEDHEMEVVQGLLNTHDVVPQRVLNVFIDAADTTEKLLDHSIANFSEVNIWADNESHLTRDILQYIGSYFPETKFSFFLKKARSSVLSAIPFSHVSYTHITSASQLQNPEKTPDAAISASPDFNVEDTIFIQKEAATTAQQLLDYFLQQILLRQFTSSYNLELLLKATFSPEIAPEIQMSISADKSCHTACTVCWAQKICWGANLWRAINISPAEITTLSIGYSVCEEIKNFIEKTIQLLDLIEKSTKFTDNTITV